MNEAHYCSIDVAGDPCELQPAADGAFLLTAILEFGAVLDSW